MYNKYLHLNIPIDISSVLQQFDMNRDVYYSKDIPIDYKLLFIILNETEKKIISSFVLF